MVYENPQIHMNYMLIFEVFIISHNSKSHVRNKAMYNRVLIKQDKKHVTVPPTSSTNPIISVKDSL